MHAVCIGAILLMIGGTTQASSGVPKTSVAVYANGMKRCSFVPLLRSYSDEGPSVSVPAPPGSRATTAAGEPIKGFEFIGWREGAGTRVLVFALVRAGRSSKGGRPDSVRREFASYLLGSEAPTEVAEMRTVGLEPLVLKLSEE